MAHALEHKGASTKGRRLATSDHSAIKAWAAAHKAQPATLPNARQGNQLGALRFDFAGDGGEKLEPVSWDEWFGTFDSRKLNFIYRGPRADGKLSDFFVLEQPRNRHR